MHRILDPSPQRFVPSLLTGYRLASVETFTFLSLDSVASEAYSDWHRVYPCVRAARPLMLARTFGRRSPWSPCWPHGFRIRSAAKEWSPPRSPGTFGVTKREFRFLAENLHKAVSRPSDSDLKSPLVRGRTFSTSSNAQNRIIPKSVIVEKMDPSTSQHGNFDLVQKVKLDYAPIELQKWTSRKTGLSVVHLDCECSS